MVEKTNNQIDVNNSILTAFKNEFATTINVIHVNSLDMDLKFREVSVNEQKSLSKIMVENEERKDVVYDSQCALINRLCIDQIPCGEIEDPKTGEKIQQYKQFDIYDFTEFDRIRILMEIYQNNFYKNDIKYKCPECGMENSYQIDFSKVIDRLNEFDLKDKFYSLEDRYRIYNFTLNYPNVRNVSNFYKNYLKKYKNASKKERELLDNLGNIDYVNLFIKQIEMVNKVDKGNRQVADLTTMTFNQIDQLIELFPQNIMFGDDDGVLKHITTEFIEKINSVFEYEKCAHCGAQTKEGVGDLVDFF